MLLSFLSIVVVGVFSLTFLFAALTLFGHAMALFEQELRMRCLEQGSPAGVRKYPNEVE